ncbi:prepilin peptidase [Granulosicoccaceae sp. 1_MG-2023]|nr:prepilin peptidase [Granulosicoccaceae sp. 1_MG-2023]
MLVLLWASVTDIVSHRISNRLVLFGLLSGFAFQLGSQGLHGLLYGAGGMLLGFVLFLPFYIAKGMAAGDVKLMAVVGVFLGPEMAIRASLSVLICGGVIALIWLFFKGGSADLAKRYWLTIRLSLIQRRLFYVGPRSDAPSLTRFPYAVAIASGTAISLFVV